MIDVSQSTSPESDRFVTTGGNTAPDVYHLVDTCQHIKRPEGLRSASDGYIDFHELECCDVCRGEGITSQQIPPDDCATAREEWTDGASIPDLVDRLGASYTTVRRHVSGDCSCTHDTDVPGWYA